MHAERLATVTLCAVLFGCLFSPDAAQAFESRIVHTAPADAGVYDPLLCGDWVLWAEDFSLYAQRLSTGEKRLLAGVKEGYLGLRSGSLSGNGRVAAWLGDVGSPWPGPSSTEIFMVEIESGRVTQITSGGHRKGVPTVGPDAITWSESSRLDGPTDSLIAFHLSAETTQTLFTGELYGETGAGSDHALYFTRRSQGTPDQQEDATLWQIGLNGGSPEMLAEGTLPDLGWVRPAIAGESLLWWGWDCRMGQPPSPDPGVPGVFLAPPGDLRHVNVFRGAGSPRRVTSNGRYLAWSSQRRYENQTRIEVRDTRSQLVHSIGTAIDSDGGPSLDEEQIAWFDTTKHLRIGSLDQLTSAARVYGADRIRTGIAASESEFPEARTLVVASAYSSADALAAAGLAGATDASLVLVGKTPPKTSGADPILREAMRLWPSRMIVVGGEEAVPAEVLRFTSKYLAEVYGAPTERIIGRDRYETARRVSDRILAEGGNPDVAFVVRGDQFADGLTAAPAAYRLKARTLLVRPTSVPADTVAAVDTTPPVEAVIVGGTSAVGPAIEGWFAARGMDSTRVAGSDRFETSAAFADVCISQGWLSPAYFGTVNGLDFPDALSAGAVLGHTGGPVLFVAPDMVPPATGDYLERHREELRGLRVFGGTNAVSNGTFGQLEDAVPTAP